MDYAALTGSYINIHLTIQNVQFIVEEVIPSTVKKMVEASQIQVCAFFPYYQKFRSHL